MANIKNYLKRLQNGNISLEEQQKLLSQVEETIKVEKQKRDEAVGQKADMVVQALKNIEAKLEAKLVELNNTPAKQGVPGPQGPAGRDGRDGVDGYKGADGRDGVDGKDGKDGKDGVSVTDAQIDFDGSLVIKLSDGSEIDAGQVVPEDTAKLIHAVSTNGGGTSQSVLDAIAAINATIATYGTMALQNHTSVDIEGGTIDNTPIGNTTPSTGKFTTLQSTGTASLGTGSANYAQIIGGATTIPPIISAQGSDTNINILYRTKGTGYHAFQSAAGVNNFVALSVNSSVNYITATPAISGVAPSISASGTDTNIPLVLQPKGTGALQAQLTDSTATGGNARGANAVDWQTSRGSATNVASGVSSFIGSGSSNSATGNYSATVSGLNNTPQATGNFVGAGNGNSTNSPYSSIVGGYQNSALGYMNFVGGGQANSATSASAVTTQAAATNGVTSGSTAVTLSGSNASIKVGQLITGTGIVTYTYVAAISGTSLTLSQAANATGTPTLSFYTPHGVVVGGGNNQATGSYSFIGGGGDAGTAANRNAASGDWSVVAGGFKNTAVGNYTAIVGGNNNTVSSAANAYGFIGGGISNTVSGFAASILGGQSNTANSTYGVVLGAGYGNTRSITGYTVLPANNGATGAYNSGGVQAAILVVGKQTTDATATVLTSDNAAASTTNQVILPNNSAYLFKCTVIAGVTGAGNTSAWKLEGAIKRGATAGSTAIVGTVTTTLLAQDAGASTWAVTATADTTNGGLKITVTGQAATTIRWVCKVETTEMTY